MVLSTQEIFVMIERVWQVHFMTRGAKLRCLMKILKKGLLVKRWLGLDQLMIHPLQQRILARRKGIMQWFFYGEVCITTRGVYVGDRMTYRACDACLGGWMFDIIKMRIVERTAKEWDGVMATRAPSRSFDVSISLHRRFASLPNADQVRGVVERAKTMGAVTPTFVRIFVT